MKTLRIISIHVFLATLFLSIPVFLNLSFAKTEMMYRDLLYYILILGLFYLNYFILIDRYYFPKRFLSYIAIILIYVLGIFFISEFTEGKGPFKPGVERLKTPPHDDIFSRKPPLPFPNHPHNREDRVNLMKFSHDFFIFIAAIFLSIMLKTKGRMEKIEEEKTVAELSFLKSQINPHFIFNILNTLYSLSLENSDKTPDAILKLSTMMRYVLDSAASEVVSVSEELKQIKTYIELQKLRFGETLEIDFEVDDDLNSTKIQPLLLIPFIENTFKHGVNPEKESKIKIKIHVNNCNLMLYTHNLKVVSTQNKENGTGLGNGITRSRLDHLYPANYSLAIKESETEFEVELKIKLC